MCYIFTSILGAYAKLPKAAISFVMSVCPSVHMEQLGSHWRDFHETSFRAFFENMSRKFNYYQNLAKNNGCFTLKPMHNYDTSSLNSCYSEKRFG